MFKVYRGRSFPPPVKTFPFNSQGLALPVGFDDTSRPSAGTCGQFNADQNRGFALALVAGTRRAETHGFL